MFQDVNTLSRPENKHKLTLLASSTSCLITIAETSSSHEVSELLDITQALKTKHKYLLVNMPHLKADLLQKRPINYAAIFLHRERGETATTSLCPVLGGGMFAKAYKVVIQIKPKIGPK